MAVADLLDMEDDKLYMTVQMLAGYMSGNINRDIREHGQLSEECIKKTADLFKWIIRLGEDVRLDAALSLIHDLKMNAGVGFKNMVMSQTFHDNCPGFSLFAAEYAV